MNTQLQATARITRALRKHEQVRSLMEANAFAIVARIDRDLQVRKTVSAADYAGAERAFASMRKSANETDSVACLMAFAGGYGLAASVASAHLLGRTSAEGEGEGDSPEPAPVKPARAPRTHARTLRVATPEAKPTPTRTKATPKPAKKPTPARVKATPAPSNRARTSAQNERELATITRYASTLGLSATALRKRFGKFDAATPVYALRDIKAALRTEVQASKGK